MEKNRLIYDFSDRSGEMWSSRQVEQGLSSFFAIFDDFSKFRRNFGMLYFERSSNMANIWQKNEVKPCSTCLKPWLFG